MTEELWKPIESLHGRYEASTLGRIRNAKNGHIKAQSYDGHYLKFGYDYVHDGQHYHGWMRVHKAVAETFIPNPEGKKTVNHISGDRRDNSVANLEWATFKEQAKHASEVLKRNVGENNYNAKHENYDIHFIRDMYDYKIYTVSQLAKMFDDTPNNIRRIVKRERWKHVK